MSDRTGALVAVATLRNGGDATPNGSGSTTPPAASAAEPARATVVVEVTDADESLPPPPT